MFFFSFGFVSTARFSLEEYLASSQLDSIPFSSCISFLLSNFVMKLHRNELPKSKQHKLDIATNQKVLSGKEFEVKERAAKIKRYL